MSEPVDRACWNARHREALRGEPIAWVMDHLDLIAAQPRGRALDVACGLGRHALLLAGLGFAVDALDVSDVAVARLADEAARRRLPVTATRADLAAAPDLPAGAYSVVVDTYFLERALLPALAAALAPGGLLVFETFTRAQADRPFGPSDPRLLLAPGELRRAFAGLEVLDHREGDVDDGDGRMRAVASLLARRPA